MEKGDKQQGGRPQNKNEKLAGPRTEQRRRPPRRRRPSRGRYQDQQTDKRQPKSRPDLIAVKDEEVNVDRIMKRLSQRASQIKQEILGSERKGIIDTTKELPEQAKESRQEASAIEFVRDAVVNDDILKMMSADDWNLKTDYEVTSHRRRLIAAPLVAFKRIIRRFTRLYTDFLVLRQSRINTYLVGLCSQLVRELVAARIEHAREVHRLENLLQRHESKLSSSVAAINARFDSDEARIDLLRGELELRRETMREEREVDLLLSPTEAPEDAVPQVRTDEVRPLEEGDLGGETHDEGPLGPDRPGNQ